MPRANGQKSSVVSPSCCGPASTRSGQSAAVMSQKRHSWRLGTRLAGSSLEIRRMSPPRFWMKAWVQSTPVLAVSPIEFNRRKAVGRFGEAACATNPFETSFG